MGKNKNITIAGIDIDAWMEADSESLKVKEIIQKKYEKKIVAFLDLLAMKDLILNKKRKPGEEREAFETIERIKGIVEIETKYLDKDHDFNLLQISDSFIFTCSENDILKLIKLLAIIQIRILIECKFQLRGAITFGDVYVADEGKQIIGPAYINAYLLQEHNAIYPRIILDQSFLNRLSELKLVSEGLILSTDTETCIDYLGLFLNSEGKSKSEIITFLNRENVFSYLESQYAEFNDKNVHAVKQKYGWTIQYFKSKGVWPNDK